VLYLANPCGDAVIAAMAAGELGYIDTPAQKNKTAGEKIHAAGAAWCADNGAYSNKFDEQKWWAFLERNVHRAKTCLFATAPDVVGDAGATLDRSLPWLQPIRELGYPAALVAQDGLEELTVPWDDFDVLFIGGTTAWKLGAAARDLIREAKSRGKHVHMGRVNSLKRYRYADAIGCDSVDGTFLVFGPDKNLPKLLSWIREDTLA
jgi:hypothetical protein